MGNIIFSIIWLIILIYVAFWVASIAAGFYIFLIPFTVCIEALSPVTDFLLLVVQFPRYCAQAMIDGSGFSGGGGGGGGGRSRGGNARPSSPHGRRPGGSPRGSSRGSPRRSNFV